MFDLCDTGMVTRFQFEEILNLLHLFPQTYEIQLVLSRYDLDGDGMLNYEQFMGFLLPFDPKCRDLCLPRSKFCTA